MTRSHYCSLKRSQSLAERLPGTIVGDRLDGRAVSGREPRHEEGERQQAKRERKGATHCPPVAAVRGLVPSADKTNLFQVRTVLMGWL